MKPSREHIRRHEGASLVVLNYRSDGFPFVWHMHPEVELTLIVSGRGQRYVGDSVEEFGAGDLVLLGGDLPHTWHAPQSGRRGCIAVVVQFMPTVIAQVAETQAIGRLLQRADRGLWFSGSSAKRVQRQMLGMLKLGPLERYIALQSMLGKLAGARQVRALSSQPFDRKLRHEQGRAIDRVCRWVAEHLDRPIRQSDAAALLHRSPSAFARFFKRMMGQSFIEYVVQLRVGRACRLLVETDLPITQVCYEAGFSNLSYFNRVFRIHRKMTPREYRRAFVDTER